MGRRVSGYSYRENGYTEREWLLLKGERYERGQRQWL